MAEQDVAGSTPWTCRVHCREASASLTLFGVKISKCLCTDSAMYGDHVLYFSYKIKVFFFLFVLISFFLFLKSQYQSFPLWFYLLYFLLLIHEQAFRYYHSNRLSHRTLHFWPHSGNSFRQLPIFQLPILLVTCWKHSVCPFPLKEQRLNQFSTAVSVRCGESSTESVELLSNLTLARHMVCWLNQMSRQCRLKSNLFS